MVGTTLTDIRDHVEALACADGPYAVHCGRTGERPIPTAGKRFESRALAERAATAATQYRAALRRYDPRLPHYDLVVTQAVESGRRDDRPTRETDRSTEPATVEVAGASAPPTASARLVEFCHRRAASVFEALCDADHRDVETAVMDSYFDLAETVADRDELCRCLLESMAAEIDRRLTPSERADVLAEAATRLPPTPADADSLTATLETLSECGLLAAYTRSPASIDLEDGSRSEDVRISGYVLSPRDGQLPVLPFVLGHYRHASAWPLSSVRVVDAGEGWELRLVRSKTSDPAAPVSVPIEPEA